MTGRAARRFSALVIVSTAYGCDNVEWGGIDVRMQEPPPAVVGAATPDTAAAEDDRIGEVPDGPVLYMAERDTGGVRLIPVGAILGDSLTHFPSEREAPGYRSRFARSLLAPGSEFVLFAAGARVGSFTVQTVETDESFCVARPAARGIVELIAEASAVNRFLALPRDHAGARVWTSFAPAEMEREQRDATLTLPLDVLSRLGAETPANILNIRWDMQAFRPAGEDPPHFTATYLLRDRLQLERPPPTAWSLFIVGVPVQNRYETGLVWFRQVARQGKGAPRLFEQMDWTGDGQAEVLLEVLGEQHRWLAALARRGGEWSQVFEDPCGAAAPPIRASG